MLAIPGDQKQTIRFAVEHFIRTMRESLHLHDSFFVALSGGSTPKAIFQELTSIYKEQIAWEKCYFFWSDERAAGPTDPESNYHMAMQAGLEKMPIPSSHIFRMQAEVDIEKNAVHYEELIHKTLKGRSFDLIMLGLGEDGHTASLFPNTQALEEEKKWVVANYIEEKKAWRMTFTYPCLNLAKQVVFYVLGASKADIVKKVFAHPSHYPAGKIGSLFHEPLWILDQEAALHLK